MAPEPPNESDSPVRCASDIVNIIQGQTSDESEENEEIETHDGYQPLNMNENLLNEADTSLLDTEESQNPIESPLIEQSPFTAGLDMMDELQDLRVGCKAEEEPQSVEAEMMADVWNKPRPQELNFELDVNSQELIKSVMSSIQLPQLAAPSWAEGLSDVDLKETVLQKVRKRTNAEKKVSGGPSKTKQD